MWETAIADDSPLHAYLKEHFNDEDVDVVHLPTVGDLVADVAQAQVTVGAGDPSVEPAAGIFVFPSTAQTIEWLCESLTSLATAQPSVPLATLNERPRLTCRRHAALVHTLLILAVVFGVATALSARWMPLMACVLAVLSILVAASWARATSVTQSVDRVEQTRDIAELSFTEGIVPAVSRLDAACQTTLRTVREMELVARGYKISALLTPIERIERSDRVMRAARLRRALQTTCEHAVRICAKYVALLQTGDLTSGVTVEESMQLANDRLTDHSVLSISELNELCTEVTAARQRLYISFLQRLYNTVDVSHTDVRSGQSPYWPYYAAKSLLRDLLPSWLWRRRVDHVPTGSDQSPLTVLELAACVVASADHIPVATLSHILTEFSNLNVELSSQFDHLARGLTVSLTRPTAVVTDVPVSRRRLQTLTERFQESCVVMRNQLSTVSARLRLLDDDVVTSLTHDGDAGEPSNDVLATIASEYELVRKEVNEVLTTWQAGSNLLARLCDPSASAWRVAGDDDEVIGVTPAVPPVSSAVPFSKKDMADEDVEVVFEAFTGEAEDSGPHAESRVQQSTSQRFGIGMLFTAQPEPPVDDPERLRRRAEFAQKRQERIAARAKQRAEEVKAATEKQNRTNLLSELDSVLEVRGQSRATKRVVTVVADDAEKG